MKFQKAITIILSLASCLVLFNFLWWHYQLGMTRYFDADELAYLHWAHNVFSGRVPFIDFLSYVPPGFLYVLAPLFLIAKGTSIFSVGRIFAWIIFAGICTALGGVFILMRGRRRIWGAIWLFVLPGVFLSFLPMPADKLMEIRPDNLAVLISLIGLISQICWMKGKKKFAFWSGFFYSLSLLILPKTLPMVCVAVAVSFFQSHRRYFFFGLILPLLLFGIWVLSLGNIPVVWYSLVKLPFEVNRIGELFGMDPNLFFYPNATYYGMDGWNIGLLSNHGIWLVGLLAGMIRLVTPYLGRPAKQDLASREKGAWIELLVAGSFLAYIVAFMYGYPLRHAQYLIPIAVFVSWYAADFVYWIWIRMSGAVSSRAVFTVAYVVLMYALFQIGTSVNAAKLAFTNADNYKTLEQALATIPNNAYVFDMVGATIYYRDPYYVSAVPFGQWEPYLSRPLPDLIQALERTKTMYLYDGRSGRLQTLPANDQSYIDANFLLMPEVVGMYKRR